MAADEVTINEKCLTVISELVTLFKAIISRSVTPKQLDDIKASNENFDTTRNAIEGLLLLRSFKEVSSLTVSTIENEIMAYRSFKEENKILQHFAHTFQEFAFKGE